MRLARRSKLFLALAALWGFLGLAVAAAPAAAMSGLDADRAKQRVASLGDAAIAVLDNPSLDRAARERALAGLLRDHFALGRIARLALGRHWRSASAADQAAYLDLFERYVLASYGRLIDFYDDQALDMVGTSAARDALIVHSRLVGDRSVAVDWRLIEADGALAIVDVVVEGVSMLVTQRNEFASIIERGGGLSALLDHLGQRVTAATFSPDG